MRVLKQKSATRMADIRLAVFRADITPPTGSPLSGGWIKPVESVTDPLYALGVVLFGAEAPVLLCALDWCGIGCEDHLRWREALAASVGTTPDRVTIHCVHQHNAPFTDLGAQRLIRQHTDLPDLMDVPAFEEAIAQTAKAAQAAVKQAKPVTHIGIGEAKVEQVASNRRVLSADGRVVGVRYSSCPDPALRDAPEGLIDPMLKTVSFWNGGEKLAALHYYATHPMSYYGDGKVSSDFCGLAREQRAQEDGALHLYFTGCAGDVAPGKYNDGSPETRPVLVERMYRAMAASEQEAERLPVSSVGWRVWRGRLPDNDESEDDLLRTLLHTTGPEVQRQRAIQDSVGGFAHVPDVAEMEVPRKRAALLLSYRAFVAREPLILTSLHLGERVCLLHLPGEPLIPYQFYAQEQLPGGFVCVAGYGVSGPEYIPLASHYEEGGYELTWTFAGPGAEPVLKQAISELVRP